MELAGAWIFRDGKIHGDVAADRIKWLIRNKLRKLSVTSDGWERMWVAEVLEFN